MALAPSDVARLRESCAALARDPARAAACFHRHLFALAPAARPLFGDGLATHGERLIAALGFVTDNADDWRRVAPVVEALAVRHLRYGARSEHYPVVGEALLCTVAEIDPDGRRPETLAAWRAAYAVLSAHMIAASEAALARMAAE